MHQLLSERAAVNKWGLGAEDGEEVVEIDRGIEDYFMYTVSEN